MTRARNAMDDAVGTLRQPWVGARMWQSDGVRAGLLFAGCLYIATVALAQPVDNQFTYFLPGMAAADYGYLSEDWQASAGSPFVVFNAIITGLQAIDFLVGVRVIEVLLVLAFALSAQILLQAARPAVPQGRNAPYLLALLLLLICLFLPMMMHGHAGQRLLGMSDRAIHGTFLKPTYFGMYLQPSEFGILLILAVAMFVARARRWPYVLAAATGVLHQSYLLSGAFLVSAFLAWDVLVSRRWQDALAGGAMALLIAMPIVIYSAARFGAGDPELMARATAILAEIRIPHHAMPTHWFDRVEALKIVVEICGTALAFCVNRRLGFVMAIALGLQLVATAAAMLADSHSLYLMFPWRISTVLMPLAMIATGISLVRAGLSSPVAGHLAGPIARIVLIALLAAPALFVFTQRVEEFAVRSSEDGGSVAQFRDADYLAMIAAVRGDGGPGQVYLHDPGRYASFRLLSGLPAFVDLKSHPYRAMGVIEWWDRYVWAQRIFSGERDCDAALVAEIRARGITHVIIDSTTDQIEVEPLMACLNRFAQGAVRVHEIGPYSVVRLS